MPEITLVAETGRPIGSRASGRLRATGKVPAVVYGHGDPVPVSIEWRSLRQVLTTEAGLNALISLEVDGEQQLTMVKELQRHPIRHNVLHVDFLRIRADEPITVEVPITLTGEAEELQKADGTVEQVLYHLDITALPTNIPTELTVDISHLQVGDSVHVSDLVLPEGVTTDADADETVAAARIQVAEVEPEVAEEEAEEAVEGEAAEGEEPAAGGESES
ncbi:MAG: 50S ribosomal protein L25 [Acidimicrobiales bacterium]